MHIALAINEKKSIRPRALRNDDLHLLEIRQSLSLFVHHPKLRISLQQSELARSKLLQTVGATSDQALRRCINTVSRREGLLFDDVGERMFRKDGHAAEEFQERRINLRSLN